MSSPGLPTLLDRLQAGLEGLLSCLEAKPLPESDVLDATWSQVHRGFEDVRHRLQGLDPADEERAVARERMEHCLRLHAVASGILVQRREELVIERAACSEARQRLRRMRAEASGASCDMRG